MRHHFTPTRIAVNKKTNRSVGEDVEKVEPLRHGWWECKMVEPLWNAVWHKLKKF